MLIGIQILILLISSKYILSIYINRITLLLISYIILYILNIINEITIYDMVESISIYFNLYQITKLQLLIKILIIISALIISLIGELNNIKGNILKSSEFSLLTFICILGMIILIESNDTISLFLSIELISFSLYIISSLYNINAKQLGINRDSQSGIKAGLKYLLLGSFTSIFILAGIVNILSLIGLTDFNNISIFINTGINKETILNNILELIEKGLLIGFIFIFSGLLFKIGAFPFYNWSPDVYDGVPTLITAWIAILPKISFIIIIGILNTIMLKYIKGSNYIFIISSLGSLIIGSILGLSQYRIKRLLSYSSIAQIGFILLSYSILESSSLESILFFLIQYTLTTINIFLIIMCLNKYFNIEIINQFQSLLILNPFLCFSLMVTFFSFAGIPPFIGFFGKLDILFQSIYFGYYFLALVAIITSIITASYYLRIIKITNFDLFNTKSNVLNFITGNFTINNFISIITSLIIFYILFFEFNMSETLNIFFIN